MLPRETMDTALHSSKDLAVSPHMLPCGFIPKGYPNSFDMGVSARTSRIAPDGSYPLLFSCFHRECPDFPLHFWRSDCLIALIYFKFKEPIETLYHNRYIIYNFQNLSIKNTPKIIFEKTILVHQNTTGKLLLSRAKHL